MLQICALPLFSDFTLVTGDDTFDGPATRDFTAMIGATLRDADPLRRRLQRFGYHEGPGDQ